MKLPPRGKQFSGPNIIALDLGYEFDSLVGLRKIS